MVDQETLKVKSSKVVKHEKSSSDNQHAFISFAFDTFGSLSLETVDLLYRTQRVMHNNVMSHRSINILFMMIDFTIQKYLTE